MKPYFEIEAGNGMTRKVSWSDKDSNDMLKQLTAECSKELRERDADRGVPADGSTLMILESDSPGQEGSGKLVVNHAAAAVKHSGREFKLMLKERWHKFCSEPRTPEDSGYVNPYTPELASLRTSQAYHKPAAEREAEAEKKSGTVAKAKATRKRRTTKKAPTKKARA